MDSESRLRCGGFELVSTWHKPFPVVGKGTVTFNIIRSTDFAIVVRPSREHNASWQPWQYVALVVRRDSAAFYLGTDKDGVQQLVEVKSKNVGYEPNEKISYWLSYDRDRMVIKYGKGYHMVETTLLKHDFLDGKTSKEITEIRSKLAYLFVPVTVKKIFFYDIKPFEQLVRMYASQHAVLSSRMRKIEETDSSETPELQHYTSSLIDIESRVMFDRCPLVGNRPPLILNSADLTLFHLDSSAFTFSASLPSACQELYRNVALSPNIALDWPPEPGQPKLTDAIRYSIVTKGKILNKKLKEKASEFGHPNPECTYLRVTMGSTLGNSPGIPYVLEIWPFGHYSPIHNHGNAHAVIKVVHGSINVHIYNKNMRSSESAFIKTLTIYKDDVTWISPNWYQTHKLENNTSGDYCATIQCYQYGSDDDFQWPYFDYVEEDSEADQIDQFLPDSDFTFTELRKALLEEYSDHLKGKRVN